MMGLFDMLIMSYIADQNPLSSSNNISTCDNTGGQILNEYTYTHYIKAKHLAAMYMVTLISNGTPLYYLGAMSFIVMASDYNQC